MAKTITTWTPLVGTPELQAAILAKIDLEVAAGNTSGLEIKTSDVENDTRRVEREWVSVAAAQAYIEFLATLSPVPTSAVVEP